MANLQVGLAEKEKTLAAKNKEAEEPLGKAKLGSPNGQAWNPI